MLTTHAQETCTRNMYKLLATNFDANMQILVQETFTLHGIELRSIRCMKLVSEILLQESMSDVQISCTSYLRVCQGHNIQPEKRKQEH